MAFPETRRTLPCQPFLLLDNYQDGRSLNVSYRNISLQSSLAIQTIYERQSKASHAVRTHLLRFTALHSQCCFLRGGDWIDASDFFAFSHMLPLSYYLFCLGPVRWIGLAKLRFVPAELTIYH